MSETEKTALDRAHADWLTVGVARMGQQAESARKRLQIASDLALMGLRTLTLINGGAIVALFTLAAPASPARLIRGANPPLLVTAFGIYAFGVALCLVAMALGYWSQQVIAMYEYECADHTYMAMTSRAAEQPRHPSYANWMLNLAMGCAIIAIVCFVAGSAVALWSVL